MRHRRMSCCAPMKAASCSKELIFHCGYSTQSCSSLMVGHKGVELVAAKHITPESEASRERGRYRVRAHRETEPFSSRSIAAKSVRSSPPLTCQRRQGKDLGHIRQKRSRRHTSPAASPAFLRIRDWNSSKSCAHASCQRRNA